MRTRTLFWLGAALLLGGLAVGIERLVVTDHEALEAVVERAGEAAAARDLAALRDLLTEDYEGAAGRDRDATATWIGRLLRRHAPTGIGAEAEELEIDGDGASGVVRIRCNALGRPLRIDVPTTFARTSDGWRIASTEAPRRGR